MTEHPTAKCCWCQRHLVRVDGVWWCQGEACRTLQRKAGIAFEVPRVGPKGFEGYDWRWWFAPLPSQAEFERRKAPRKLWGGSAGPGKSYGARKLAYRRAQRIPGLNVLLVRKTYKELERTHIKAMRREAEELGFEWVESRYEASFPKTRAVIECGHLEDEAAVQKYLSAEYDLIIVDEAVQVEPDALMELMSRARTSNPAVMAAGGAEVWLVTNPGGPSHNLLKSMFIDHEPDIETYPAMAQAYRPEEWVYMPATLDDNPYIDPEYERLALSGLRRARYQQLRRGDWDAAEGTFFGEVFSKATHTRTVPVYAGAEFVEAFDWGYGSWSCWGSFLPLPDNHWHCVKCLKFKKVEPEDAAGLIQEARAEIGYQTPQYAVADPKIFSQDRGESIAETMRRFGVAFQRATNKRTSTDATRQMGWPRLASWFKFDPRTATAFDAHRHPINGVPWLTFDPDECKYLIRTLPQLMPDPHNPEDIDTTQDDHGADMCRYFVMSRPPLHDPHPVKKVEPPKPNTWGMWKAWHKKRGQRQGALA